MKMIFEEDNEYWDFLEFILSPEELYALEERGLMKEFPEGLYGKNPLNVFIRVKND